MYACLSADELKKAGWSSYQIRLAKDCCLSSVRRGFYVIERKCSVSGHEFLAGFASAASIDLPKETTGLKKERERHRILVRSYVDHLPAGAIFSHMSALVVHGITVPFFVRARNDARAQKNQLPRTKNGEKNQLARTKNGEKNQLPRSDARAQKNQLARTKNGEKHRGRQNKPWQIAEFVHPEFGSAGASMHMRQRELSAEDATIVSGVPVTSVLRTLWDIARDYPLAFAVAAVDDAIHRSIVSDQAVREYFAEHCARRRQAQIDRVLDHIDGDRESIGESICAVRFVEHSITGFVPQVEFRNKYGTVEARADFTNEDAMVIVEVDGQVKYYLPGVDPKKAFEDERKREYLLRNRGYQVFRIRWNDLFTADVFIQIKDAVRRRTAAKLRDSAV